jgi:WD40 repeat protein
LGTRLAEQRSERFGRTRRTRIVLNNPADQRRSSAIEDRNTRPASRPVRGALATFTGHTAFTRGLAFTPGGAQLATGSVDQSVQFWPTNPAAAATQICALSGPTLSQQEWDQYVEGAPNRPLC